MMNANAYSNDVANSIAIANVNPIKILITMTNSNAFPLLKSNKKANSSH